MIDDTDAVLPNTITQSQVINKNNNIFVYILIVIILFLLGALAFTLNKLSQKECTVTMVTPTPTSTPVPTITESTTLSPTPSLSTTPATSTKVSVSIYLFSKTKFDQEGNTNYTQAVTRETSRKDLAAFSIEEIIKGPTTSEQTSSNLKPTFGQNNFAQFVTASNCNGKDFTISIVEGDATLKFCRGTTLSGDSSGYVISQQVNATLKQFSTIKRVRILNVDKKCFDSLAGLSSDQCWE